MPDPASQARKRQVSRLDGAKPATACAAMALAKSQAYQDAADAPANNACLYNTNCPIC